MKHITLITPYHFGSSDDIAYTRLLRSLSASIGELKSSGTLILVANGTNAGAADPADVIRDLRPPACTSICVVELRTNVGNVGGLNAGIARALVASSETDQWIGSVQSSTVLRPGWLDAAFEKGQRQGTQAVFGRLLLEDQTDLVWADGHSLCKGLTRCVNYLKPTLTDGVQGTPAFPCLSAAIFRGDLVERIVQKYGNFVCESLNHFGDCTDVALRALTVEPAIAFAYCPGAIALKRLPTKDLARECCSQLLAAKFYYEGRSDCAERRVFPKLPQLFMEVQREADARYRRPYSWTGEQPPRAPRVLDPSWGQ